MSLNNLQEEAVVVTDTSCFIILEKISLLSLLPKLFKTILTTPEIAAEYKTTLPEWVVIIPVKNKTFQIELSLQVDTGEASAIALAHEIENKYLITDDLKARKLSVKLGLSIIGSLGVLLRAKEAGLIELIAPFIEQIKQTNFRGSDNLYLAALRKAGEL